MSKDKSQKNRFTLSLREWIEKNQLAGLEEDFFITVKQYVPNEDDAEQLVRLLFTMLRKELE